MNHKIASVLGISALAAVALVGRDADASWVRQHTSACFSNFETDRALPVWKDVDYTLKNEAVVPTVFQELMCAVPDSDAVEKGQWTTVNLETWVGSVGIVALLCEEDWSDAEGNCSSGGAAEGAGHQTIALGSQVSSVWNSGTGANFGYIYVDVGEGSELRGIFYNM
jgi:hypothetical protein